MIVTWESYHVVDGRDFEDLKKRASKRFAGKDIRILQWGFKPLGTPFVVVEAVMPKERKTETPVPAQKAVSQGLVQT